MVSEVTGDERDRIFRAGKHADPENWDGAPRGYRFDRCPDEDKPDQPIDPDHADPCEGCPGWGEGCGAIWTLDERIAGD